MSVVAKRCPNCGAPLEVGADGSCFYCGATLEVGAKPAPAPAPLEPSGPFAMEVDDVFAIRGRGTVVVGKVGAGQLRVGDAVVITSAGKTIETRCIAIEMFRKTMEVARAGDHVGLLLDDIGKDDVTRGDWVRAAVTGI